MTHAILNPASPIVVVAAHSDDETIGWSAQLFERAADTTVVHVTDGAPRLPRFFERAGFTSREAYASARREETFAALGVAGIPRERCLNLGFVDLEATLHLLDAAQSIEDVLRRTGAKTVVTHSYEGGHPDHDATAFAVRAAADAMGRSGGSLDVIEFALYHWHEGQSRMFEFLPSNDEHAIVETVHTIALDDAQRRRKRQMADCYSSQRPFMAGMALDVERVRCAPRYDFNRPPHAGPLNYERYSIGMTGEGWLAFSRAALSTLASPATLAESDERSCAG